jgi:hypothetical protein
MAGDENRPEGAMRDERGVTLTVEGRRRAREKMDQAARQAAEAGDEPGRRLLDRLHAA